MAKKTHKPYIVPLDPQLANEILNIPIFGEVEESPKTIGERVDQAVRAVEQANEYLAQSALAAIVAQTLMRQLKKRGFATIQVQPDGTVVLQVEYYRRKSVRKVPTVKVQGRQSRIPYMKELRATAKRLGVDISDLGVQRKAIHKRLQAAQEASEAGLPPLPPEPGEASQKAPEDPVEVEHVPEKARKRKAKPKPKPPPEPKDPPKTILRKKGKAADIEDIDIEALLQ